jgi:hypothetical protein
MRTSDFTPYTVGATDELRLLDIIMVSLRNIEMAKEISFNKMRLEK